jgi:MFS superfamily sulfate permease-like transporter
MNTRILSFAHLKADIASGFMVFLLALPLSLGIAKASGFPAAMGVLSAIIGGLVTTFFRVAPLTIKGPAAGLITICSAAIMEFGGTEHAWQIAAAALVVSALIQIAFGLLKFGALSDFFPHTAVHGMLAAIGIIIIAKQIPVLLGDDPALYKGEGPLELLLDIPEFITHAHWHIAVVGIIGLVVMFGLPLVGIRLFKSIPAPVFVLLLTIPLSIYWHFNETEPAYSLVEIGNFWGSLGLNSDFSEIGNVAFWKYVLMFLFVGSLESLLTVKATDNLDPQKRTSNYNGDLIGLGFGNLFSGILGGTPMISEVVRSSSNVSFGAQSKWSNFFHGLFLLLAMLLLIPYIELIPNAALAAMLIFAGFRLASPKAFSHVYHLGKEQLVIFLVTIMVTLAEDLLLGIAAGMLTELIFHLFNGAKIGQLFKPEFEVHHDEEVIRIKPKGSLVFTNLIGFKRMLNQLSTEKAVQFDVQHARLIDHSFVSFLHQFAANFKQRGGQFEIAGLERLKALSDDPLCTRKA